MFINKLRMNGVVWIAVTSMILAGVGLTLVLRALAGPEGEPPNAKQALPTQARDGSKNNKQPDSGETPRTVTVNRPVQREAAPYQDYTGRLESLRSVDVRPEVSGVVQKVVFKAGADVKKGDLLFELDGRMFRLALDKAGADLALAQAKMRRSDADLKRAQQMVGQGQIPREEFDKVTEQAAIAEASVNAAMVEIDRAKLNLDSTRITAPMDGQVGRPLVDAGTLVFRGQDRATLLTTVSLFDPIGLSFEMDENSFLRYQRLLRQQKVKGAGSELRMAVADEEGFPHDGTLASFDDHINPKTGTVGVRGILANPGHLLLPGMFVRVHMAVGPVRSVLEVPDEAILSHQGKRFVVVVNDNNFATRRDVTLGEIHNKMRVIEKGLSAEDWVVTDHLADINLGEKVKPEKAAPK
jgi:RND family efflux transporter MFP subunit